MATTTMISTQQQQQQYQQQNEQETTSASLLPIKVFMGKQIGSGKTSDVFECYINDQSYALKQYKQNHIKFMKNETNALQQLAHTNIIEYIGQTHETGLLLQNCCNGEVFDYLQAAGDKFPAELSRFYGLQLAQAVGYIHSQNFAHLDIKLENCLFDENFQLKLADFGFAINTPANYKHDRYIGTHRYMAPEVEKSTPYDAKKADVFALGCVIFILELGFQPIYEKATECDKYYQYFAANQLSTFWKWLERSYKKSFNPDFKDLIGHMMQKDVSKRYSIEQVLSHKYFQGNVYNKQSRVNYMNYLKNQIKKEQN